MTSSRDGATSYNSPTSQMATQKPRGKQQPMAVTQQAMPSVQMAPQLPSGLTDRDTLHSNALLRQIDGLPPAPASRPAPRPPVPVPYSINGHAWSGYRPGEVASVAGPLPLPSGGRGQSAASPGAAVVARPVVINGVSFAPSAAVAPQPTTAATTATLDDDSSLALGQTMTMSSVSSLEEGKE